MIALYSKLNKLFTNVNDIFYSQIHSQGYWSNLNKEEQSLLLSNLKADSTRDVINKYFPALEDIIFNPMRSVGLRLLEIKKNECGVDYGCMWGNLLIYAARNCKTILGIDQTQESLEFVKHRLQEENINNCFLLNADLKNNLPLEDSFDFAIVNGVLEWIPEKKQVDLKVFLKSKEFKLISPMKDPKVLQRQFLKMIRKHLKKNGRMYLAIENRYDYQYFLWKKDPHPNIYYTAFLPRQISNLISNIWYGRPYVNYLYSFKQLELLIKSAGFDEVEMYAAFPDYRFPIKIIPFGEANKSNYEPVYHLAPISNIKRKLMRHIRRLADLIIYKKLKLFSLAPSIIMIVKKG